MPKYRVGDKVRIRPDLVLYEEYYMENHIDSDTVTDDMTRLCGQVATISRVSYKYGLDIDSYGRNWTDAMLLPYTQRISKTKPITQGENYVLDRDKTPR